MNPLTRNRLVGMFVAWPLTIWGWSTSNRWVLGVACVLFALLTIERWDNYQRGKVTR